MSVCGKLPRTSEYFACALAMYWPLGIAACDTRITHECRVTKVTCDVTTAFHTTRIGERDGHEIDALERLRDAHDHAILRAEMLHPRDDLVVVGLRRRPHALPTNPPPRRAALGRRTRP